VVESMIRRQFPSLPRMKNLHQIDFATSGIYILATNRKAASKVQRLFERRAINKVYLAIVRGHVSSPSSDNSQETGSATKAFVIDQPIADDPGNAFRMRIHDSGRAAHTTVQTIQCGYYHDPDNDTKIPITKVFLYPKSGRRHQLRVHLQSIGHPILGDYNYESPFTESCQRMMLHAYQIDIPLP
ncbi:pseudouridine synthase, partial [Hesseltinella vesiculosa]